MAAALPSRPKTNSTGSNSAASYARQRNSLSSFPSSTTGTRSSAHSTQAPANNYNGRPATASSTPRRRTKPIKSQYPASSTEKHVEYILVAGFHITDGSTLEHSYPGPVGGDEHMLAELMLPDQTHLRSQDWTVFFLHKDAGGEEEEGEEGEGSGEGKIGRRKRGRRRKGKVRGGENDEDRQAEEGATEDAEDVVLEGDADDDEEEFESESSSDEEQDAVDGPPLVYVLNLVNTKQDLTAKRGAIVKAMAICTRHSFLHIYKPLLLLALEHYFAHPEIETLASLYDAVNSMDLSLMPRLNSYERSILQSTDVKDLFIEKFEAIHAQRMSLHSASSPQSTTNGVGSLTTPSPIFNQRTRYGLPRDTHEFESVVHYSGIPIPIKVPTALLPETVGDFSLIKLISTFSGPHSTSAVPFSPQHPHLTTSGPLTHPIIVLLNALLTQKRIIFLGHNLPSSSVAEAVLGACSLASGGVLRGFTRHAFPYTDLTKIDDLLKVPGFIAGVTNPTFEHKPEWWDLLCDLGTGRMRISGKIDAVGSGVGEGMREVLGVGSASMSGSATSPTTGAGGISVATGNLSGSGLAGSMNSSNTGYAGDTTGDVAFMAHVVKAIEERHGENAIRMKFRKWVVRFTRLAAAFEEVVYGASALQVRTSPPVVPSPRTAQGEEAWSPQSPRDINGAGSELSALLLPESVTGYGYVWPSAQAKLNELTANATRIEGWRNTRSYYNYVQDLAASYPLRPVKSVDLQHLHDSLAKLRLGHVQSGEIYLAICGVCQTEEEIGQLLSVIVNGVAPSSGSATAGDSAGGGVTRQHGLSTSANGFLHHAPHSSGGTNQTSSSASASTQLASSSSTSTASNWSSWSSASSGPQQIFYLALGLMHPQIRVREAVADLLGRVRDHEAGRLFFWGGGTPGFVGRAWEGVLRERERRAGHVEG